jgi:hypothetical protein
MIGAKEQAFLGVTSADAALMARHVLYGARPQTLRDVADVYYQLKADEHARPDDN